jgi:hypothetical protein
MTARAEDGLRKETIVMANRVVNELRKSTEAAWGNIGRQLQGMDTHLERPPAPGEWTARQLLCHLLFEPGFEPVALLERFATTDLPVVDITPGVTSVTPERQRMSLAELLAALDAQRRQVFAYLDTLSEADLGRKARIPLFEVLIGTDEITLPIFVGAMFDRHWNGHAEQLAQIRQAAGLPAAR